MPLVSVSPLSEDLRAFYKEPPLLCPLQRGKRSQVQEYIHFQTNLKLKSYMNEVSEISTFFLLPFILLLCLTVRVLPPYLFTSLFLKSLMFESD